MVVRQRVGRRVDEGDAHRPYTSAALEPLPPSAPALVGPTQARPSGTPLLIRSWNLFHGRSHPPGRRLYLEEAVRLAVADGPDLVAVQEIPLWAASRLARWSGMRTVVAVAKPALAGPFGGWLQRRDPRRMGSGVTGQAIAVLLGPQVELLSSRRVVLNPRTRRERRVCLLLGLRAGGHRLTAACLHASIRHDFAREEIAVASELLSHGDPAVLCGDLNVPGLGLPGFSQPLAGIDQVLVRGLDLVRGPDAWPLERRRIDGVVVSDHAPVEAVASISAD